MTRTKIQHGPLTRNTLSKSEARFFFAETKKSAEEIDSPVGATLKPYTMTKQAMPVLVHKKTGSGGY